jgi:hypothetical protein
LKYLPQTQRQQNQVDKAVLTYNVEPTVLFDLDDHTKEEGIIDALQTIRGHDAVTFTAPALRKAAEVMYNV